jgi:hypothetical protein
MRSCRAMMVAAELVIFNDGMRFVFVCFGCHLATPFGDVINSLQHNPQSNLLG